MAVELTARPVLTRRRANQTPPARPCAAVLQKTQGCGGRLKAARQIAQDLPTPQRLPADFQDLIGNPSWPLVRIGEAFKLWLIVPHVECLKDCKVTVLPAHKHQAVRLKIHGGSTRASEGRDVVVSVASHFWDDSLKKYVMNMSTCADGRVRHMHASVHGRQGLWRLGHVGESGGARAVQPVRAAQRRTPRCLMLP